jgi:hypothetical protein
MKNRNSTGEIHKKQDYPVKKIGIKTSFQAPMFLRTAPVQ